MAVNTEEIGNVYNALEGKVTGTLDTLLGRYSITEATKGQVISNSIVALIQISASTAVDSPVKEAQTALIEAQTETEIQKKALTIRQREAYDDNLRIKGAEFLSNVVGMFGAGGTTIPTDLNTAMFDAIDAITPETTTP